MQLFKPQERRRCPECNSERLGEVCWKCGAETFGPDPNWEEPKLPDVEPIRKAAREVGYAIAVHGSLERDLDLVAIPWTEEAVNAEQLILFLCNRLNACVLDSEKKLYGRMAYSIQLSGYFKLIDLSVMPKV